MIKKRLCKPEVTTSCTAVPIWLFQERNLSKVSEDGVAFRCTRVGLIARCSLLANTR
jgi:hypothetical protein